MASIRINRLTSLLIEIRSTIAFDQPKLSASLQDRQVIVYGLFRVLTGDSSMGARGKIAEYQIQIEFDSAFPNIEPKVFDVGKAITRDADHHVNPDGSCCLVVWEVWTATTHNNTVQDYFDGPLKNFFLSQYLKQTTGVWPFGEETHGKEGVVDAFADLLGCAKNEKQVRRILRSLLEDWPRGHWNCPCGSGSIIRKCCAKKLSDLSKKVPPTNARRMLACLNRMSEKR